MRRFVAFCEAHALDALPATPETVVRYVTWLADHGRKVSTIKRATAAIAKAHRTVELEPPTATETVRLALRGIAREHHTAQKKAPPVLVAEARALVAALDPETNRGARDRAIILVGFAAALRRSEVVGLDTTDLEFVPEGVVVTIRSSKTDQTGEGMHKAIHHGENPSTCPVKALRAWLALADIESGPVFRSIDAGDNVREERAVDRAIKRAARLAGLQDRGFSGHSLRAGLATQAALNGHNAADIARQTGHRSLDTVLGYIRVATRFEGNVTAKIGL
jgi:integrase